MSDQPAPATTGNAAPAAGATKADSIEAVRDLLFGQQLQSIDNRFAEVEQRLFSRLSSVQSSMMGRLEELEVALRESSKRSEDKLEADLVKGQGKLSEATNKVEGKITEMDNRIKKTSDDLTDAIGKVVKEFQDQLFSQHKFLGKEVEDTRSYVSGLVESRVSAVEQSGVTKDQFADALVELGGKLRGTVSEKPAVKPTISRESRPSNPTGKPENASNGNGSTGNTGNNQGNGSGGNAKANPASTKEESSGIGSN